MELILSADLILCHADVRTSALRRSFAIDRNKVSYLIKRWALIRYETTKSIIG